jgi:hypothetical protein
MSCLLEILGRGMLAKLACLDYSKNMGERRFIHE